jgi:hypothetical protein
MPSVRVVPKPLYQIYVLLEAAPGGIHRVWVVDETANYQRLLRLLVRFEDIDNLLFERRSEARNSRCLAQMSAINAVIISDMEDHT